MSVKTISTTYSVRELYQYLIKHFLCEINTRYSLFPRVGMLRPIVGIDAMASMSETVFLIKVIEKDLPHLLKYHSACWDNFLRLGEEFLFQVFPFAKQFLCFCNTHKGIFIY